MKHRWKDLCAQVILDTVTDYLDLRPDGPLREVNLCNIDSLTANIFLVEARRRFEG